MFFNSATRMDSANGRTSVWLNLNTRSQNEHDRRREQEKTGRNGQKFLVSFDEERSLDGDSCVGVDHKGRVFEVRNEQRQDGQELVFGKLRAEGVHEFDGVSLDDGMDIGSLRLQVRQDVFAKEPDDVDQSVRACDSKLGIMKTAFSVLVCFAKKGASMTHLL